MTQSTNTNPSFQLLLTVTEQTILELGCNKATLQEIMNRTGLSKGAIYHYVKSKDELFSLILEARMQSVNEKFHAAVNQAKPGELIGPLQVITEGIIPQITDEKDVSNIIFVYLLSRRDDPRIQEILQRNHQYSLELAVKWIQIGQQYHVIPEHLDAHTVASSFLLYVYGLRVQRMIVPNASGVDGRQLFEFFYRTLRVT
ncbi:TetR/AcrR family transcriptional regulator [Aneurinibacillus aneurinilyticus]|jgi:AcrR family transcriptional regulator|uniref:TetR/AcrR family transcriptional regulator n=2 Tax=Aneurinibacillus aneurinilyticus TaxID=1391 RepID=A0A848CRU8_ANEAE|nr:TetR/AcrR family transcriptional regulator [Aneurinibacillus aneurinilyticus]ERI08111.1 transcriptional regulator, TetR family [Aneurinibacillus aneurinilyticus ATCC 12856]MCI1694413.1 TetR/AcrR family transcriptional regulator [Aneurinibacillus aneurinilyticus]MED0669084.1 TetR/AcrR family transcriptional regulator [Aneurinibacillus aneurinilyticus]MED0706539.1 TetR/AcrR family transcriptional regulator [Aneurinibacillus aneurinilyticus]MED0724396.1 TetR/AcrR family transcriptional regulat